MGYMSKEKEAYSSLKSLPGLMNIMRVGHEQIGHSQLTLDLDDMKGLPARTQVSVTLDGLRSQHLAFQEYAGTYRGSCTLDGAWQRALARCDAK